MSIIEGNAAAVAVGIDAAVVANHHVVVRRPEAGQPGTVVDEFVVSPTLAGMERLTKRLVAWPGAVAVAEPTSMTWLPLSIALRGAGVGLSLVGNRHSARLRSALAGKNKSDAIDATVLSRAGEFFELCPARIPGATELALRRAAQRRGKTIIDANRCLRRVISQARWAFPDLWNAFAGSRPTALGVLGRWPHLDALARARVSSITEVVAAHTRGVRTVEQRAQQIRSTARAWAEFWDGHLDLDALGWETADLLADLTAAEGRVERATEATRHWWEQLWGDDPVLLSVPGMGPRAGPDRAGVPGRWQPSRRRQGGPVLRRAEPVELVQRADGITLQGDHQGRPARAAPRVLPGRQRGQDPRSTARRVLPAAHGRARPLPHQGQLRGRTQARRPHLGHHHQRHPLPAPRPRRHTGHPPPGHQARR